MKRCYKCKEFKDESEFSKDKTRKDGFNNKCKVCEKIYRKEHKKERDKYFKVYRKTFKGKQAKKKFKKIYRIKHPLKHKAHCTLQNAVANGKIIKPKFCSICDKENEMIHGHHEDYSKPLEVVWCCPMCHTLLDINLKRKI